MNLAKFLTKQLVRDTPFLCRIDEEDIAGPPTRGWEHARRMEKPYWDLKELKQLRTRFEGAGVRQMEETR